MRIIYFLFFVSLLTGIASAQSGRTNSVETNSAETQKIQKLTSREMFTQAANYVRDKAAELDKNNVPYSSILHSKLKTEQKTLSVKYISELNSREKLIADDQYHIGMLHMLAKNESSAILAFEKFFTMPGRKIAMEQTARAGMVLVYSKQAKFLKAEKAFSAYSSNLPKSESELAKMAKQMAVSYLAERKYEQAAPFAKQAFESTKSLLFSEESRAVTLSRFLDSGVTLFETQKELARQTEAEETLETMRKYSVNVKSHSVYFRAVDEKVRYLIDTNRKPKALEYYKTALKQVEKDFEEPSLRNYIKRKLRKRKPHYKILGEVAPELSSVDSWLPNKPKMLKNMRGKVVLLDFWATWCGPCLAQFPALTDWHNKLGREGLIVLGVTRYYGQSDDGKPGNAKELEFLREFKTKFKLPYPFVVAADQSNQSVYGAKSIPTAVLIDKKGIVRFIETGTGEAREKTMHKKILELLAEE